MGCWLGKKGSKKDAEIATVSDREAAQAESREFTETMDFLSHVKLFTRLPREAGAELFVIQSGEAVVLINDPETKQQKQIAQLGAGDYFGEQALLREETRSATIQAATVVSALKLTRSKFRELGLQDRLQFPNRKAVGKGGSMRKVVIRPPSPKTPEEEQLIATALRRNKSLKWVTDMDDDKCKALIDLAWREIVEEGTELIKEGDTNADYFYVVQEGDFEVKVEKKAGQSAEMRIVKSTAAGKIGKGGSFGELALLYLAPRAATVKALTKATVWVIERRNFKNVIMRVSRKKIDTFRSYLDSIEILSSLLTKEKTTLAESLVEMRFSKNDAIITEGEEGNTFYILYEGDVAVIKKGEEITRLRANAADRRVHSFGERALLKHEPRAATMKVVSDKASVLALDKESFDLLLGPLEEIMKRKEEDENKEDELHAGGPKNARIHPKIYRKDLQRIALLGTGAVGTVELWEHKETKVTYAMKAMSKGFIVHAGLQDNIMNEKHIFQMTNSDFIIKLYECYAGTQTLYFLMQAALGGELYTTYQKKNLHGNEKHAKFYAAGVCLAFEHMHARRIIYRDLKPENCLLSDKGKFLLTDMGLAKFVIGKTYTTCGTPDYFAPEVISATGHTNAVDWWCLGILIFEFLTGAPPFEAPVPMKIFQRVMDGIAKVDFPSTMSQSSQSMVKALLKPEALERLPMLNGGLKNIRKHDWYYRFDWEKYEKGMMEPPYIPVVNGPKDVRNFVARKDDMPKMVPWTEDGSSWDREFATCL
eukprot:TRINITY_DN13079_c1_g2_i2.p1 TRINITY_DN13079_c1_g2~~TRINITY_DN13079_c1_g2_i2.p1  ORF type:complete len:765 (+),score=210.93 TRINITY_DN13079_c1_g2_i2:93-2387(+)